MEKGWHEMKIIHRISALNKSRTTQHILLATGITGPLAGYWGFGEKGLFVVISALGVLILASTLWAVFAPD